MYIHVHTLLCALVVCYAMFFHDTLHCNYACVYTHVHEYSSLICLELHHYTVIVWCLYISLLHVLYIWCFLLQNVKYSI